MDRQPNIQVRHGITGPAAQSPIIFGAGVAPAQPGHVAGKLPLVRGSWRPVNRATASLSPRVLLSVMHTFCSACDAGQLVLTNVDAANVPYGQFIFRKYTILLVFYFGNPTYTFFSQHF